MKNALTILVCLFAAESHAEMLDTGTLIFVENSSNVVESYTDSSYTHVTIVVMDDGYTPWVYDAAPPVIRRVKLVDWLAEMAKRNEGWDSPAVISIVHRPYSPEEMDKIQTYLVEQEGRPYSLRSYLRSRPGSGIHCSEMCAGAFEAAGHQLSTPNFSISPGELRELVRSTHVQQGEKLVAYSRREHRRSTCRRWIDWWRSRETLYSWYYWESLKFCW